SRAYKCLNDINPELIKQYQDSAKPIVKDSLSSILKKIQNDSTLSKSDYNNLEEVTKSLNKRNIVYIQYSKNCKQKAEDISKQLSNLYIIPPNDAVDYEGKNEIRYFNDEDKPFAENLKNDLQKILGNISFNIKLISLRKTKVPLGQLEVWLNQDICK
ncbi:MAG: hypothetical protein LH629_00515, partial [Ignavibacteria bacterium]|nr:hypothetical protein [Ignavibacteria bacterium]